jgi:hypothetical protein
MCASPKPADVSLDSSDRRGGSSSGEWACRKLQVSVVYDVDVPGSFRKLGRPLAECVSLPVTWCRSMTDELIKFAFVLRILSSVLVQHPHSIWYLHYSRSYY